VIRRVVLALIRAAGIYLVIRAGIEVLHRKGYWPENWLADLLTQTPSPQLRNSGLWVGAGVLGLALFTVDLWFGWTTAFARKFHGRVKAREISQKHGRELADLWREGQLLYESRVVMNFDFLEWHHKVTDWSSRVSIKLARIDPGVAFSFESIGHQHRQNQNRNYQAQYESIRAQLGDRLAKLRLITGRHLGIAA
jgi:hypothetical protein